MAKKLQSWRIFVLKHKAQYIDTVRAADEDDAIKARLKSLALLILNDKSD